MIKVIIIEDEIPARKKLKRYLESLQETVHVVAEIDTVNEGIKFLSSNEAIDLILSDIELLDGSAFEIFSKVKVSVPIIFTTAYDQFWMDAFESNGIEYLMKPFSLERFQKAWDKFLLLRGTKSLDNDLILKLNLLIEKTYSEKKFKKRFSISTNHGIYFIETEDILFFKADEGVVFAIERAGRKHVMKETTLKDIEIQIDPLEFFRINRGELVNKKHIERIERYTKNSLAIKIKGLDEHLLTSQSNTSAFREWIEI